MENEKHISDDRKKDRLISLDETFKNLQKEIWWTDSEKAYIRNFLSRQERVDAVPVIRCKDFNWIPVTMRKPDLELVEARAEDFDLFPCLVVNTSTLAPRKRYITKAWYDGVGFMDTDCVRITPTVTHWMSLPDLPEEGA